MRVTNGFGIMCTHPGGFGKDGLQNNCVLLPCSYRKAIEHYSKGAYGNLSKFETCLIFTP
jgi:hypothetical protein